MELEQLIQALQNADRKANDTSLDEQTRQQAREDARYLAPIVEQRLLRQGSLRPAEPQPTVSTEEDVARSALGGAIEGTALTLDIPSQAGGLAGRLVERAARTLGMRPEYAQIAGEAISSAGPFGIGDTLETATRLAPAIGEAEAYEPQTTLGRYARTTGTMVPGALMPGGPVARTTYGVLAPGLGSEAMGQLAESFGAGPVTENIARIFGAVGGPGALSRAQSAITPNPQINPLRFSAEETLRRAGVEDITAGQVTGSPSARAIEGTDTASPEQLRQFRDALVRSFGGQPADDIADILVNTDQRFSRLFGEIAENVDLIATPEIATRFSNVANQFRNVTSASGEVRIISNIENAINRSLEAGRQIPTEDLMGWRSTLSKLTQTNDFAVRQEYINALEVVDDILAESLVAAGRADDVARLGQIRGQYRDFKAFERAALRPGQVQAMGDVTPETAAAAMRAQNAGQYVRGQRGEYGDIARAGERLLASSPTVSAGSGRNIYGLEEGLRAEQASTIFSQQGAATGLLANLLSRAVGPIRRGFYTDPLGQAYLRNQLLPAPPASSISGRSALYGPLAVTAGRD